MSSFISRRASNARSLNTVADRGLLRMAKSTTTCLGCSRLIIPNQDMIIFDFIFQDWVHAGRGCLTSDKAALAAFSSS